MNLKHLDQLIVWSQQEFSHLPWRKHRSIYGTLVSEIMLQQTTVGAVMKKYEPFIEKFSSLNDLADLSDEDMQIAWKGLGYYRRARLLKNAAKEIVENHRGLTPKDRQTLLSISGIGQYTASAIRAIGYDLPDLAIDANLERVISRYYGVSAEKGPKMQSLLYQKFLNNEIFPERHSLSFRALNEAMMDLGRHVCKSNVWHCDQCPLQSSCKWNHNRNHNQNQEGSGISRVLARNKKKKPVIQLVRIVYIVQGSIALYQKNSQEWLFGQWEFPTLIFPQQDEVAAHNQTLLKKVKEQTIYQYPTIVSNCPKESAVGNFPKPQFIVKSAITHYQFSNSVMVFTERDMPLKKFQKYLNSIGFLRSIEFFPLKKLGEIPLSVVTEKILKKCSLNE